MRISEFETRHVPQARALWEQSDGVGLSAADEPAALITFLVRNPGLSYVAEQRGQIVGTILCGHDGRRGLVHHLVVSVGERRKGLGRELLQHGLDGLRRIGIDKAHLLVFKSNASGLAFWRAIGAEERNTIALFSLTTGHDG